MAEVVQQPPALDGVLAPVEQRGSLVVAERAVAKLVRAAALSVPGVAALADTSSGVSGTLTGALGRDLPRVDVQLAGHRMDAEVEVATLWPYPAAAVAARVREEVASQVQLLAGISADVVSVAVVKVVRASAARSSTRRVQ